MGAYVTYMILEIKRALKTLPRFLTGAIVLIFLLGTIVFSASKAIYGEAAMGRITVGVVLPHDDQLAKTAISMLSSMDSVKSICDFEYIAEEEGRERLNQNNIHALMLVPDGFVSDIISGANTPIQIILPDHGGIESMVFKELADAGARTLSVAQASIYAADEICIMYQIPNAVSEVEEHLNKIYFNYSLPRDDYFRHYQVSAINDVTALQYYGISAVVLCLFFCGIPLSAICIPEKKVLMQKLKLFGIGIQKQILAKIISAAILLWIIIAVGIIVLCGLKFISFKPVFIPVMILLSLTISSVIVAVYQITVSQIVGVMCLFWLTIGMMFLSGGLIPAVFMPESVRQLAPLMPTTDLITVFKGFLGIGFTWISMIKVWIWGMAFYLIAVLSGRRRV